MDSSSASLTPTKRHWKYDVFLSFRGEDTRGNFTDYLYAALIRKGIYVFRDDESLERGKDFGSTLLKAIEDSKVSIVVFSKNYASSGWCLNELAKIVECMDTKGQLVLPVFYDVDPSDVRKQKGHFEKVFAKHEENLQQNPEKVKKWREAMTAVANLSGWNVQDRSLVQVINEIVEETFATTTTRIWWKAPERLVGISSHFEKLRTLLDEGSENVHMIGIHGVGGIGKTTIARVLYDNIYRQFEVSCFLPNVREVSERDGLVRLQQLLCELLGEKNISICNTQEGITNIRSKVGRKKVFVILDDVNEPDQLRALVGARNWFGSGSRIIITTRDRQLLAAHGVDKVYSMKMLNHEESLQLFCAKAFDNGYPADAYLELFKEVVRYCRGLPLALEVSGSFFRGISVSEWQSLLGKLKVITDLALNSISTPILIDFLKKLNPVLSNHSDHLVTGFVDWWEIGKIFVSGKEIGKGSHGTVVHEGEYDGRLVAVKMLMKAHHDVALKEIQNLMKTDDHENIVRFYGSESSPHLVFLALELCLCSLNDLIHGYTVPPRTMGEHNRNVELWKANDYPSVFLLKLMRDIVRGLGHLHKRNIVHRDLKPQNILISKKEPIRAKISDLGISKRLPEDKSSLTHATGCGTPGWQAPEILRNGLPTRAADIFSLGCVLYFCITKGKHPFGDVFERDRNILKDGKDLSSVGRIPEAEDLFSCLMDPNPDKRPEAQEVYYHPLFWTSKERLSFLQEASDHFEGVRQKKEEQREENESELLNALERAASVALDGNWDEKMHIEFIKYISGRRNYKYDSICDLVRVIRNQSHHYGELDQGIKELLGLYPEDFYNYFSSRFPKLLIEVYKVVCKHYKKEKWFLEYTQGDMNL